MLLALLALHDCIADAIGTDNYCMIMGTDYCIIVSASLYRLYDV
jgi:hypothetical protein